MTPTVDGATLTVRRYSMAGMLIESAFELRELEPLSDEMEAAEADLRRADGLSVVISCTEVDELPATVLVEGDPTFVPIDGGLRLVVPGLVLLFIHADGSQVDLHLCRNRSIEGDVLVSHLLVDHAIPRLLVARGATALHATCVVEDGNAFAFLGESGTGKSTMAVGFCADGAALVADDCLVVRAGGRGALALPSYPGGRLRDDSFESFSLDRIPLPAASGKKRISLTGTDGPTPLVAIILLVRDEQCEASTIEKLAPSAALWALASHGFASALADREMDTTKRSGAQAMVGMRWLAEKVPVLVLRYPSNLAALADVRSHVRAAVHDLTNDGMKEVMT